MHPVVQQRTRSRLVLAPERGAGLHCLHEFLPFIPGYAEGRNFDKTDNSSTSLLSPYLRYRLLREREVVAAVLGRYDYDSAAKFIEEVCWRTYWKGFLEVRPKVWTDYDREVHRLPGSLSPRQQADWSRARAGQTGIECFDAWVDQLQTSGWLHNHARMWFASIWIFTLNLPWQLGAAFFMEHLLDGDPAANTLSWRWVAGLHTPGKTYLATAGNIRRFTAGRFHPEGQLATEAEPVAADGPYPPNPLPPVSPTSEALLPSLSSCPAGLLVTPEDLSAEVSELGESPFSSICVFNAGDIMDRTFAASRVRAFVDAAVMDAAGRLSRHWDGKTVVHEGSVPQVPASASPRHVGCRESMRVHCGTVDHWVDGVLTWAENENLKSVWLLQPPIGPWRDSLPVLRSSLRMRNIELREFRRAWDASHWPHARGGYFQFRKGLRDRLSLLLDPA